MSALAVRRALLVGMPLVLLLAGCRKQVYQPDLPGEIQEIEGPGAAVEAYGTMTDHPCPNIYELPCADGTGCSPADGTIITHGPPYDAPEFSWTYGCNPDGYRLTLRCYSDPLLCDLPILSRDVTTWDHDLHGPARSYDPDMTLEPGYYKWWISAFQSDIFPNAVGTGSSRSFWVGEICEDAEDIAAPLLSLPMDGDIYYSAKTSMKVDFSWHLPDNPWVPCLPDDFNGQIAEDAAFTARVQNIVTGAGLLDYGESEGELKRCRTYYWRVRGMLGEEGGPWSATHTFKIMPSGSELCLNVVVGRALVNLSCRVGPGTDYGKVAYLAAGETHAVDGRNASGTHVRIADLGCYVPTELVDLESEEPSGGVPGVDDLPVLADPPTPTPPPIVCRATMGPGPCAAAGGTWIANTPTFTGQQAGGGCDCP